MKRIIDVSHWQGVIDWSKVAADGVDGAIIKIGGGDSTFPYVDGKAVSNYVESHHRMWVGVYWYFSGRNTNTSQLDTLRKALATLPSKPKIIAVDIEDQNQGATEVDRGLAFAESVRLSFGIKVVVYTGAWWWDSRWLSSTSILSGPVKFPLWVASYAQTPKIPKGWSSWLVWQKSDTGSVAGVLGNVDINEAQDELLQEVKVTRGQPRIDYGRVVHVLPSGATVAEMKTVQDAAYPTRQTVGFSYDDAGIGDLSNRRAILWNIPTAQRQTFVDFYVQYYPGVAVEFRSTTPDVIPPPTPVSGRTGLGVNVVTGDMGVVNRSLDAKCTAAGGINMFGQLSDLAARRTDLVVMARRYVTSMPPADPNVVFEGAGSPHLVYLTPLNECDVICNGSVEQIKDRAAYDGAMWAKMKAMGRKYAGGGFSVGTSDYTSSAVCDAMKAFYAPLYNDGMGFNYHLYSPWKNHTMDIWYEGRWRFLFEKCGFNPNPSLAGIYCDETGVDQGSLGGFPACGYSATEVETWGKNFLSYSQSDGYGNLLRAALVFQGGNTSTQPGGWAGYNVDTPEYLAALGRAAQSPITRQVARPRIPSYGEQPVIVQSPRKVLAQWE